MAGFQKIVLYTAIIILIVTLIIVGYSLRYAKKQEVWPPMVSNCPDYWTIDGSGNDVKCIPGKINKGMVSGSAPSFTSMDTCGKYTWAHNNNVSWDGITYGYGSSNPCSSS